MIKKLEGRNISYGIINDLEFSIRQGEVIALMGSNGAGKSTLARIIAGLIEPASGSLRLLKDEQEIPWTEVKRWQEIGIIGQHPRRQTLGATVGEELGFGLLNLGLEVKKVQEMVRELAFQMGFAGKLNQSPATLSGGERQRLVLASILALRPSFLLLDEALSMLDARAQEACLKILGEKGKHAGQLWITHDPKLAEKADRLWLMKEGKLLDMGVPHKVLEDTERCQEYGIRAIYCSEYSSEYPAEFSPVSEKTGKKYLAVQALRSQERYPKAKTQLEELESNKSCILEWQEAKYSSRLQLTEKIKEKSFLAVLGPSGAGKSTLLESAIALLHPFSGKLLAFGQEVNRKNPHLRQHVRLLLQEPGEYILGSTVYDEVFYLQSKKERKEKTHLNQEYLEVFGISSEKAKVYPECLSGGERQRVALAAALESLPKVLLLDEPLLGLDAEGRSMFQGLLRELKGQMTIVYVTHDWSEVRDLADEVWLIQEGRITLRSQRKSIEMNIGGYIKRLKEAGVRC